MSSSFIFEDKSLNAFAMPGGFVVIHRLLLEVKRPEILGVLAHSTRHNNLVRNLVESAGLFLVVQMFLGDVTACP